MAARNGHAKGVNVKRAKVPRGLLKVGNHPHCSQGIPFRWCFNGLEMARGRLARVAQTLFPYSANGARHGTDARPLNARQVHFRVSWRPFVNACI